MYVQRLKFSDIREIIFKIYISNLTLCSIFTVLTNNIAIIVRKTSFIFLVNVVLIVAVVTTLNPYCFTFCTKITDFFDRIFQNLS